MNKHLLELYLGKAYRHRIGNTVNRPVNFGFVAHIEHHATDFGFVSNVAMKHFNHYWKFKRQFWDGCPNGQCHGWCASDTDLAQQVICFQLGQSAHLARWNTQRSRQRHWRTTSRQGGNRVSTTFRRTE
ncbi:hypothetical protein D3C86_1614870 [compost metagenome]